jgi:hypothetical protein
VQVPDDVRSTLFASPAEVEGAIALAPLAPGQAVARTAVRTGPAGDGAASHDLSFALERDRALNGRIQAGELVDLVATYGSGAEATTEIVARGARVIELDAPSSGGVGSTGTVVLTVAFGSEADVLRAANALEVASVTLTRSTATTQAASTPPASAPGEPASGGDGGDGRDGGPTGSVPPATAPSATATAAGDGPEARP